MRSSSARRIGAAAIAVAAITAAAPAAHASSVITRPTSYTFTGSSALSQCQAFGQQEVATAGWDGYSCKLDPTVGPGAYRLWVIIWVGCPTCKPEA